MMVQLAAPKNRRRKDLNAVHAALFSSNKMNNTRVKLNEHEFACIYFLSTPPFTLNFLPKRSTKVFHSQMLPGF